MKKFKQMIGGLAVAATVGLVSGTANAALVISPTWDALYGSNGLAGVKFNIAQSGNMYVGLGAHRYVNGVNMGNNGVDTFYGESGLFPNPPVPPGQQRANWSFDWIYDTTGCATCNVFIQFDQDWQTSNVNFTQEFLLNGGNPLGAPPTGFGAPQRFGADSWNMMMGFLSPLGFDPNGPSSTAFQLTLRDAQGGFLARSTITVNVPEPGSLALAGLALALMGGFARSRRV